MKLYLFAPARDFWTVVAEILRQLRRRILQISAYIACQNDPTIVALLQLDSAVDHLNRNRPSWRHHVYLRRVDAAPPMDLEGILELHGCTLADVEVWRSQFDGTLPSLAVVSY